MGELEGEDDEEMNHGFELFEILKRCDFNILRDELNTRIDIGLVAQKMGAKSRIELARRIIEMSGCNPNIVRFCILKDTQNIIGNEILKISFDYGNYEIARESILSGASLQEIILLCDDKDIEKIGSSIFEMHKRYSPSLNNEDIVTFFCNQLIGSKQILKQAIAKEALLHGDYDLGKELESDTEIIFGSRRATLRKRFPRRDPVVIHPTPRLTNPTQRHHTEHMQKPLDQSQIPSSSSISFFDSLKVTDTTELQRQLNNTTAITTTTISNLCINFLANQPLTPMDVMLMGVIVGVIVGIVVGIIVVSFALILM